jgi:putative membrane protein
MLKKFALSLVMGVAAVGPAMAQQAPANPPISTPSTPPAAAPAPGANSFTEAQAKMRLENQGFTGVSALMKDKDGIWRGMASKAGRSVNVSVDYQGNIVEK